jgi:hypothetical protein
MALRGQAALAMWWDIAPALRAEFEDWHTHEHFPERLAIPGFLRAARWSDAEGGPGFFVMYELAEPGTLASPAYLARLNDPTPWSRRLMPHHADMVRTQCEVVASRGGAVARHAFTLRIAQAAAEALLALVEELPILPGFAGAHLLRHAPPSMAATEEQRIRGLADRAAELVFVVCGYDLAALRELRDARLAQLAARHAGVAGLYTLSASMLPGDPGQAVRPCGSG